MNKKKIIVAIITLIVDQIIKAIVSSLDAHVSIIKNIFDLYYIENTGAAWSILEGKTYLLVIFSVIMLVLIYKLSYSYKKDTLTDISFGLLYGGILGNLNDRVVYGYVRDFISIHIFGYNFPIFNIADMAIVCSIFIIAVITFKGSEKDEDNIRRSKRKN